MVVASDVLRFWDCLVCVVGFLGFGFFLAGFAVCRLSYWYDSERCIITLDYLVVGLS